jgi:hypothetical protein
MVIMLLAMGTAVAVPGATTACQQGQVHHVFQQREVPVLVMKKYIGLRLQLMAATISLTKMNVEIVLIAQLQPQRSLLVWIVQNVV